MPNEVDHGEMRRRMAAADIAKKRVRREVG